MDMLSINAEQKLARLAAVIGKSTQSWKHWSCVRIQIDGTKFAHEYDCILWAQPIIDAYLGDLDGRIYFCGNLDIHVLCKSMSAEMLSLVGLKIAELMAEDGFHPGAGGYALWGRQLAEHVARRWRRIERA